MSFKDKAVKRLVSTTQKWKNDRRFSYHYAVYRVMDELGGRLGLKKASLTAHKKKDQYIITYIEDTLASVIEKYRNDNYPGEKQDNAPIWVCWWTGLDSAPKLVRQCVKSIRTRACDHPVILITENNVSEYLNIPAYITEKHQSGAMGMAQLSDYLRIALLDKYGGLWLDSTIFCAYDIPEEFFSYPFFTCKSPYRESGYISQYRWTAFCMGGWKGNIVFRYLREGFEKYWLDNDYQIDYLFIDYLINSGWENVQAVKRYISDVPDNTPHRDDLQAAMNAALPAEKFWDVIQSDTPIYKLSWRETYSEVTADGGQSVYGYFLNMNM